MDWTLQPVDDSLELKISFNQVREMRRKNLESIRATIKLEQTSGNFLRGRPDVGRQMGSGNFPDIARDKSRGACPGGG